MPYIIRATRNGKTVRGMRLYRTLAGANKSIKCRAGRATIRRYKLSNVTAIRARTIKGRQF